ncbi:hypothetical protein V6N11_056641 [Hibiscus sabdariffa]|uniref:glutathione transferase n=1 Tax=Hibiscus sabdariffa TaxID=183260 RepID=A0ABR2T4F7_9ROSI
MAGEVVLLDFWASPFAMRAKLALSEKGITYECKEQDLLNKGPLLLQAYPVHKKIPRSQALFWADYVEKNIYDLGKRIYVVQEDQAEAKEKLIQCLKTLETELGDKLYFGGDGIGFVDVALLPFTTWFQTYETSGNFSIQESCPKLVAWVERCREKPSVSEALPHPQKIYDFYLLFKEALGVK